MDSLEVYNQVVTNALLGFSCRSKSWKDFRADVKTNFCSALLLLLSVRPAESRQANCSLSRLIVLNPALFPPRSSPEALHVRPRERPLVAKRGIMGEKWPVKFSLTVRLPRHCRVLSHATNLRHGTDGFTYPPKEGRRIFFRPKNPTASAGFEPANLGTRGQHALD
jgi:hypothetical protein